MRATHAEQNCAERTAEVYRFMDDDLAVYRISDELWVGLRSLCKAFHQPLKEHLRAMKTLPWARVTTVLTRTSTGQVQPHMVLDLASVSGWLFTLPLAELPEALRPKLVTYQRQCAEGLATHFLGCRMGTGAEQLASALLESLTPTVRETLLHAFGPMAMRVATLEQRAGRGTATGAPAPAAVSDDEAHPCGARDAFRAHQASERERILGALEACNWNRAQAAVTLGIPRRTFYRRMNSYGIQESRSTRGEEPSSVDTRPPSSTREPSGPSATS
jgi:hypothetical protein